MGRWALFLVTILALILLTAVLFDSLIYSLNPVQNSHLLGVGGGIILLLPALWSLV